MSLLVLAPSSFPAALVEGAMAPVGLYWASRWRRLSPNPVGLCWAPKSRMDLDPGRHALCRGHTGPRVRHLQGAMGVSVLARNFKD